MRRQRPRDTATIEARTADPKRTSVAQAGSGVAASWEFVGTSSIRSGTACGRRRRHPAFQCSALIQINRQPHIGRNVPLFEEMSHG